jgi:tRNA(fMet)-specific endonuclease VapC
MRGIAAVVDAMSRQSPADLAVSTVTECELYTGVEKCSDPERERKKVSTLVRVLVRADFDSSAAREAANIRAALERCGMMIGPYDVLLAGQARSHGLILVTSNVNEFLRVPSLGCEDWS